MSIQSMRLDDKLTCPQCGGDNDSATGVRKPQDGDITICAYCAGINQFIITGHEIKIIEASEEVISELQIQHPDYYMQILHVQAGVKQMQKD